MESRAHYIRGAQLFKSEYKKFKKVASDYEDALTEFDSLIQAKLNDIDLSKNDILKNKRDGKLYVVSKNKFIMRINDKSAKNLEPSREFNLNMNPYKNKLVDIGISGYSNLYYSTKVVNHINSNITENSVVQVGLSDIGFEDIDNHSYKKIKNDSSPTLITNSSSGYCSIEDAYKCQSKAKMTNKRHYGLVDVSNTHCECYIFDDIKNMSSSQDDIYSYDVETDIISDKIEYFGILFDGSVYGLTEKIFKNNFDGMFLPNDQKCKKIFTGDSNLSECNPFTGSGMYDISIVSIDQSKICNSTTISNEYTSKLDMNINKSFETPNDLNLCRMYPARTTDLLNDYFTFDISGIENNVSYGELKSRYFTNYILESNSTTNPIYKCYNDEMSYVNPSIHLTYKSKGDEKTISSTTYGKHAFSSHCDQIDQCTIRNGYISISPVIENDRITSVKLNINYNDFQKSYTLFKNLNKLVSEISPFENTQNKKITRLNIDTTKSIVQMLKRNESVSDNYVNIVSDNALYSEDLMCRIIIGKDDSILKLQFKQVNFVDIENTNAKYGVHDDNDDYKTIPINSLDNDDSKSVGKYLNNMGYIGMNHRLKPIDKQNILKSSSHYIEYPYYKHNNLEVLNKLNMRSDCDDDPECIGYLEQNNGNTQYFYKIDESVISDIYQSDNINSNNYKIFMKKFGVKIDDKLKFNSENTEIITIADFNKYTKDKNASVLLQDMIKTNHDNIISKRRRFINSYTRIINLFEKLSEDEIKILKGTELTSNEISKTLLHYTKLVHDISNYRNKSQTINTEKTDYDQLMHSTRIQMGMAGLASIGTILALFHFMRR